MRFVPIFAVGLTLAPVSTASAFELYLSSDVGVSLLPNIKIKDIAPTPTTFGISGIEVASDPGVAWTISFGAHVTENLSLEVQTGYFNNDLDSVDGGQFTVVGGSAAATGGGGDLEQVPILFNALFELPLMPKNSGLGELKLALGGGVGLVYVDGFLSGVQAVGVPLAAATVDGDDWTFGYQGTAALLWSIAPNIDLGIRYRFMGTTEANFGPAQFNTPILVGQEDVKASAVYTNAVQASLEIRF